MNPKVGGASCGVDRCVPSVYGSLKASSSSGSSSMVSISQMVMPNSFMRLTMFCLMLGMFRLYGLGRVVV